MYRLQRERVGCAGLGETWALSPGEAEVISDISVRVTLDLCGAHLRGTRRFAPKSQNRWKSSRLASPVPVARLAITRRISHTALRARHPSSAERSPCRGRRRARPRRASSVRRLTRAERPRRAARWPRPRSWLHAARIRETRGPVASSRARAVPVLARASRALRHPSSRYRPIPGTAWTRHRVRAYAAPPPSAGDDLRPEDRAELLKKLRKARWDDAPKPWKEF